MKLKDHDLKQIDRDYVEGLAHDKLVEVSLKLLADLKEARDLLNQTPQNSSRPSGSYAPWEGGIVSADSVVEEAPNKEAEAAGKKKKERSAKRPSKARPGKQEKKKRGKQKGAKGYGRKVELEVTAVKIHKAEECAACGEQLGAEAKFEARTGLLVLDVEMGNPGLQVSHVKHLYGDSHCRCGHVTRTEPGRCEREPSWEVELTEWHLAGPTLVSLIVCLSLRMRMSRPRIQEFLNDWLGIYLSVGVINQSITEGGRAVEPVEEQLIAEIQQSELLYADETGWKENGRLRWLWVLISPGVTLFLIGRRSWDVIADVLEGFAGWLMSDGYQTYRRYARRLRCLAHLIRKARGLSESLNQEAQLFGEKTLAYMVDFIEGIYRAREGPGVNPKEEFVEQLAELKAWCQQHRDSEHEKTRQLAREFLNDWQAIWTVLDYPDLPITNNIAERALRHWVIARKISYGTRTKQGSRAFALLASVIETCRQRKVSPWTYLAEVVAQRRRGNPVPPLPVAAS
jgi:transposase